MVTDTDTDTDRPTDAHLALLRLLFTRRGIHDGDQRLSVASIHAGRRVERLCDLTAPEYDRVLSGLTRRLGRAS